MNVPVAARVTRAREGADGRAAVLAEGKELATERIVVPARAAAAPYIAKIADRKAALVEKKEALLADKRLARALDALHEAHAHRAWPTRTGPGPRAPGLAHGRPVDSDTTRVITEAGGVRGGGWGVGGRGGLPAHAHRPLLSQCALGLLPSGARPPRRHGRGTSRDGVRPAAVREAGRAPARGLAGRLRLTVSEDAVLGR